MLYEKREIKNWVLVGKKSCINSEGQVEEVCGPSNEAMH